VHSHSACRPGDEAVACVAGGIVRVRRKILTVVSAYGRRSRKENGRIGGSAAIAPRWPRKRDMR
ncbi:MAG: hypothetical protein OIF51_13230, partial [Cellvibrionaceae bacterium]|nr:hypothetical protein [Cellvibrionaceae bacterium]